MHTDEQKRSLKRMVVFGVACAILMAAAGVLLVRDLTDGGMRYLPGGLAVQPRPLAGAIYFVVFLLVPPWLAAAIDFKKGTRLFRFSAIPSLLVFAAFPLSFGAYGWSVVSPESNLHRTGDKALDVAFGYKPLWTPPPPAEPVEAENNPWSPSNQLLPWHLRSGGGLGEMEWVPGTFSTVRIRMSACIPKKQLRIGGFYWKDLTSGYRYRLDGKDSTHQPCRVPG